MSLAKDKPDDADPTGYEDDVHALAYEQAERPRPKRFSETDIPGIIEEIEGSGSGQLHAPESSYRPPIAHWLKWPFQSERRSGAWNVTIARECTTIGRWEKRNPSLKADTRQIVNEMGRHAVREAAKETGLPRSTFPAERPYAIAQLRDHDWMPE